MIRITIEKTTKNNMKILGIESFPFTEKELKTKFRALIKENHTDTNNKATTEKAAKIIAAYKVLSNLVVENTKENNVNNNLKKDDLFDLSEPCPHCINGKVRTAERTGRCPYCYDVFDFTSRLFNKGKGYKTYTCKSCRGTGKFQQARSKRIVTCKTCNGKGYVRIKCKNCNGTGYIKYPSKEIDCSYCNGTGRIENNPFNPVIEKSGVLI